MKINRAFFFSAAGERPSSMGSQLLVAGRLWGRHGSKYAVQHNRQDVNCVRILPSIQQLLIFDTP